MSTQYNPDGSIPAATKPWAQVPISSSTNANPIVITTSGNHGFTNGDTVGIEGHATNTNANGLWPVTVLSLTTFSIPATGNGVGGATGYCVDYSVNPLFTLPADIVDLMNVSSVNPALEGLGNAIPFLYKRAGQFSLIDTPSTYGGSEFTNPLFGTSVSNAGWTDFHAAGCPQLAGNFVLKPGDKLIVVCQASVAALATVGLEYQVDFVIAGGSPIISGSNMTTLMPPATNLYYPVTMIGYYTAVSGDAQKAWTACVAGKANGAGPYTASMAGIINFQGYHYRSNA